MLVESCATLSLVFQWHAWRLCWKRSLDSGSYWTFYSVGLLQTSSLLGLRPRIAKNDQLLIVLVLHDSACRTAASAAADTVEEKRCGSESDLCPPAAVRLLMSRPVRRSQRLPALVRMP